MNLNPEIQLKNYKLVKVYHGESTCVCGTPINTIFLLKSPSGRTVEIGRCCARKFGLNLRWRSKADYLNSALLLASNEWEENFVKSLINRLGKWGSRLIVTKKQKAVLERISKRPWRWRVYEDLKRKNIFL
jgi:glutathione peroxidase-family protein